MYGVIVFIIFLFIGSISTMMNRDALHLHCLFSRYMFRFFELNERNFVLNYYKNNEAIFDDNNVRTYGKILQSHKYIVLAMLDELRNINSKMYPSDLMMVNLYLNNITGSLNVYSPCNPNEGENVKKYDKFSLRSGYVVNHKMITATLLNFIYPSCRRFLFTFHKLNPRFVPLRRLVIHLSKLLVETDIEKIQPFLNGMILEVDEIFQQTLNEKKFEDFLPKHMLFYDTMSGLCKRTDAESASTSVIDDVLNLMCDVVVNSHVNNQTTEHTVGDLLDYEILNFDGNFLKSYQQQVLAATIHPLFICVHMYVKQFNLKFDYDRKMITKLGNKLLKVIYLDLNLDIYPQKVKTHVYRIADKLKIIVNHVNYSKLKTKNPNLLSCVLNLCSKPMLLNRLKFESQENVIAAWSDVEQMIVKLEDFVYRVLILHENSFLIVKRTIDHRNMFRKMPRDCFQSVVVGSLIINDNEDWYCRRSNRLIEILDGYLSDINNKSTTRIEHDNYTMDEIQEIIENETSSSNFKSKSKYLESNKMSSDIDNKSTTQSEYGCYTSDEIQEIKKEQENLMKIIDSCLLDQKKKKIARNEHDNSTNEIKELNKNKASSLNFKSNNKSIESNKMSSGEVGRTHYEKPNLDDYSYKLKGKNKIDDTDCESDSTV
ncbi:uncharacterized protein LOC126841037 isoform X2 [Adelges cooleyi]|uniref:uncharacterized protein LOC126841037 isoform X2 n=1 Tax=Adelges cooleyi TaxID=133065 RepID=UPI00217FF807|nr:uncharacterized protein LOC126841037 isoform X2 [Adelges cooleyi]